MKNLEKVVNLSCGSLAEIGGEVDRGVAEKTTFEVQEDDLRDLQ